ncbi:MAG: hypothetical protein V1729_04145 [Candidatus Woesearchaeota archaeon]
MDRIKTFRRSKKAQVESQFNWLFVLIIGVIILAFFTVIVLKQKTSSEIKFAGKMSQQLNTILVGAKVSSGTVQEIPVPEMDVQFQCNDYFIGPASQRLGNRIIFAPEYLKTNKLVTWTLDWSVPFKVASILYVSSPFVRYVIIGGTADDPDATKLHGLLPEKMNKQVFSISDYSSGAILDENDRHVRFIFVNQGTVFNIPQTFSDSEVSGLSLNTNTNEAQFLVRSLSDSSSFTTLGPRHVYNEPEILYAAIFSTNPEEYECLMKRLYERLNVVAQIYSARLNEMADGGVRSSCQGNYRSNAELQSIITTTNTYPPAYPLLTAAKTKLRETNERLQLQSCPMIY